MKLENEKDLIRVVAQRTMDSKIISLIAEEEHQYFAKGSVVARVPANILARMLRPLKCEIKVVHSKGESKILVTPVKL